MQNRVLFLMITLAAVITSCNKVSIDTTDEGQTARSVVAMSQTPQTLLSDPELVRNGSFENGTGNQFFNWELWNGAASFSATTTASEVFHGSRAMKVVNTVNNGSSNFWKVQAASDSMPTINGARYIVRLWAKAAASSPNGIRITTRGGPATLFLGNRSISTSWAQYEWTFTATSAYTRICLDLGADANSYFIDGVSVIKDEPSLIKNGSFETGSINTFTNWQFSNGAAAFSATTAAGEVYQGIRAMKVVNAVNNGPGGWTNLQTISDSFPTVSGSSYSIRLWARTVNPSPNGIGIQTRGGATLLLGTRAISTTWAPYEWNFTANSAFTRICLDLGADANTYFVDNIVVKQSDSLYSRIWGAKGELWDRARIPDFTNAGYMSGNAPVPDFAMSVDVTSLGAIGNGIFDNTAIFRAAIQQCAASGTVYIPAGRYLLSDTLLIKKSGINIKGAGSSTVLYFTRGLEELYPRYNGSQSAWSWEGGMILFGDNVSGSGIRSLNIEFPDNPWAGHNFRERGYNGIGFGYGTNNCWLSDITLKGCDLGIWMSRGADHITAENWKLTAGPNRMSRSSGGKIGHHAVNIYGGYNLLQNFELAGRFHHDLSIESEYSKFNVFRKGRGTDICIDHHDHAPRNNLFTNLDLGTGSRPYESGGGIGPWGISINETYWNITATNYIPYNYVGYNSSGIKSKNNVAVGLYTNHGSATPNVDNNWYETIQPHLFYPKDLYAEQMRLVKNRIISF